MKKKRKNPVTAYLARIGGKGGRASAARMTQAERTKKARAMAAKRWGKKP